MNGRRVGSGVVRRGLHAALLVALLAAGGAARADAIERLRAFVTEVKSGKASFTQTVTSADGARSKTSSGEFEFLRPNRFRFLYSKPFEQLIVADGQRVWIFDADLNQASSRPLAKAIGATPAALLAGGTLDNDFTLADDGSSDGIDWVRATPKAKDGPFRSMRIGFRGADLAAIDIVDAFGQRSLLRFTGMVANAALPPERFRFVPPKGADVVEQ
ncbi:MAG: outer membrane lipoprotein chaperone LolA [Burkholderiales bacterium]|nr:outer membrane lipoprotein chaperone LolA [Burkholderiales bacterium]